MITVLLKIHNMSNILSHKLLIISIKYIPIIQLIGMLFNDVLYFTNCYTLAYITDYIFGNSVIFSTLILICSYTFDFCTCYRLIILCNFINSSIGFIDRICHIPVDNIELIVIHCIIIFVFVIIINILHLFKKL